MAVEVLYYGIGEGTWAAGKPGFLFHALVETPQGEPLRIVSDGSWQCTVDRAHRPAQPKRWFLRALQEEFDARQHPQGWDTPEFAPAERWIAPMLLSCPPDKPPSCSGYSTTDSLDQAAPAVSALRARQIPLVREVDVPAKRLADAGLVHWKRDPLDWFDFRIPDSFEIARPAKIEELNPGAWRLPSTDKRTGVVATFEFAEQIVGFPYFEIDAPAGAVVELITQESHDPQATAWMDNHFYAWSRFICREGVNRFEAFDYESLRWLQLHVRDAVGPVVIRNVGVRRRMFPWPHPVAIGCSDPALQRLFDASINTLNNSAIETVVDGMGRERQQYSGDGGHQLIALRAVLGEPRLSARFLRTFSEGLTKDGYFLDCWPAYDRLARVAQKQVDGAYWGPLLDHGIGFNFDCWKHYQETGDLAALAEPYPRLVRFAEYLLSLRDETGLLPVENLGIPTVWIDHDAYRQQRHKQCAFNLYAAAMFQHVLAPLAEAFGDADRVTHYRDIGTELLSATVQRYWSASEGLFVDNLPWLAEEGQPRTSDRALATAVLFDQCPGTRAQPAIDELANCPPRMGFSYPCNAGWRLWALAKAGRGEVVLNDLRTRWAPMRSVIENNTLQEAWTARPDSREQWSHCAVVPLYILAQDIAGIRPTAPGYAPARFDRNWATCRNSIWSSTHRTAHCISCPLPKQTAAACGWIFPAGSMRSWSYQTARHNRLRSPLDLRPLRALNASRCGRARMKSGCRTTDRSSRQIRSSRLLASLLDEMNGMNRISLVLFESIECHGGTLAQVQCLTQTLHRDCRFCIQLTGKRNEVAGGGRSFDADTTGTSTRGDHESCGDFRRDQAQCQLLLIPLDAPVDTVRFHLCGHAIGFSTNRTRRAIRKQVFPGRRAVRREILRIVEVPVVSDRIAQQYLDPRAAAEQADRLFHVHAVRELVAHQCRTFSHTRHLIDRLAKLAPEIGKSRPAVFSRHGQIAVVACGDLPAIDMSASAPRSSRTTLLCMPKNPSSLSWPYAASGNGVGTSGMHNNVVRLLPAAEAAHVYRWQVAACDNRDLTMPGEDSWSGFADLGGELRQSVNQVTCVAEGPARVRYQFTDGVNMEKTISLFGGCAWIEVLLSDPVGYYWDFDNPQNFAADGPTPGKYLFSNGATGAVGREADGVPAQVKADSVNWGVKWNEQQLALGLITPEVAARFVIAPGAGAGGVGIEGSPAASHFITFAGQLDAEPAITMQRLCQTLDLRERSRRDTLCSRKEPMKSCSSRSSRLTATRADGMNGI